MSQNLNKDAADFRTLAKVETVDAQEILTALCLKLKDSLGLPAFNSWIADLMLELDSENGVTLIAPNQFHLESIQNRFDSNIREAFRHAYPQMRQLRFEVRSYRPQPISEEHLRVEVKQNAPDSAQIAPVSARFANDIKTGSAALASPSIATRSGKVAAFPRRANTVPQPGLFDSSAGQPPTGSMSSMSVASGGIASNHIGAYATGNSGIGAYYRFDNFITSTSNKLAFCGAEKVVEKLGHYRPLYIHGPSGVGKSHLLRAIAYEILQRYPTYSIKYVTFEEFMSEFMAALQEKTTHRFKQQWRHIDVLIMDDIQLISGKGSTQEEFLHTYNALMDAGKQVVFAASVAPYDLKGVDERIRSRLSGGLVADIQNATYDLRLGFVQKHLMQAIEQTPDLIIDSDFADFIANSVQSSLRELEGAVNKVLTYAELNERNISISLAKEALKNLLREQDLRLSIEEIQRRVARHFHLSVEELRGRRRTKQVAIARQMAMFLARKLTSKSLPEIGKEFGGRDHSTVLHAIRRIEADSQAGEWLEKDVTELMNELR